jgi:hypothetical protein
MSQSVRDNQWAKYEKEITSLYQEHTLHNVMQLMNEKHGFRARYMTTRWLFNQVQVTNFFQQERLRQEAEIVGSSEECQEEPRRGYMELH